MNFFRIFPYIFLLIIVSCKKQNDLSEILSDNTDRPFGILPADNELNKLSKKFKEEKKKNIEKFYNHNWAKNSLSGGFLVSKNGEIIYEKYNGLSNRAKKTEITADTPLHIASVSKVLTAAVILKLVDFGKLSLDQKVNSILPEFPYEEITVKMLLNHRSGLPNYAYFADDRQIWNRSMLTNKDILDLLSRHKFALYFNPDRKFSYCNTNYAMLALIIEKVTGTDYRKAMKKIVFEPLGMKNTFVFDYEKHKDTVSQSYKGNNTLHGYDFLDDVYGDKNIYSTPRDLLKFDRATYSDKFLNPELVKEAFKGYSYETKGIKNYGLGIRLHEWETGEKIFYHNGWWHGNTSSYVTLKQDTVAIIALSNKFTYKTYKVWKLATLFGNYPIKLDKDDVLE